MMDQTHPFNSQYVSAINEKDKTDIRKRIDHKIVLKNRKGRL